jgi:hypothetical protein
MVTLESYEISLDPRSQGAGYLNEHIWMLRVKFRKCRRIES